MRGTSSSSPLRVCRCRSHRAREKTKGTGLVKTTRLNEPRPLILFAWASWPSRTSGPLGEQRALLGEQRAGCVCSGTRGINRLTTAAHPPGAFVVHLPVSSNRVTYVGTYLRILGHGLRFG